MDVTDSCLVSNKNKNFVDGNTEQYVISIPLRQQILTASTFTNKFSDNLCMFLVLGFPQELLKSEDGHYLAVIMENLDLNTKTPGW